MASNLDCVVFLGGNKLGFYESKGQKEEFALDENILIGQHLADEGFVENKIKDFFEKLGKSKLRLAILVDSSFVFEKYVNTDPKVTTETLVDDFFKVLPFSKTSARGIVLPSKEKTRLMIINWQSIQALIEILRKYGEVGYVGVSDALVDQSLDSKQIQGIIANRSNINWLVSGKRFDEIGKKSGGFVIDKKIVLMVVLVLLISISVFAVGVVAIRMMPPMNKDVEISEAVTTPSPTPTPTAVPTPVYVSLSEMRVRILNGSGISGQAKAVARLIEPLGVTEIDTGNATQVPETTTMTVSPRVNEVDVEKIKKILEEEFGTVEVVKESVEDVEIIITTSK